MGNGERGMGNGELPNSNGERATGNSQMRNTECGMRNGNVKPNDLRARTKQFALRVIKLVDSLPNGRAADVIGRQILRSATSVGANYRSAQRGRSKAEFCAKLGIVEEECDESSYWLELLTESGIVKQARLKDLMSEANEITAMVVASIRTARAQTRNAELSNAERGTGNAERKTAHRGTRNEKPPIGNSSRN
jgi:four helix bundle protein